MSHGTAYAPSFLHKLEFSAGMLNEVRCMTRTFVNGHSSLKPPPKQASFTFMSVERILE